MKNRYKQVSRTEKGRPYASQMKQRMHEGLFLLYIACAIFLLISLFTYSTTDPGWLGTGVRETATNWGGMVGAWLSDVFLSLFGLVAFLFPVLIIISSLLGLRENDDRVKQSREWMFKSVGWTFTIASSCALVSFYYTSPGWLPANSGGMLGDVLGHSLSVLFNKVGSTLLFTTMLLSGITLVTGFSWLGMLEMIGGWIRSGWVSLFNRVKSSAEDRVAVRKEPFLDKFKKVQQGAKDLQKKIIAPVVKKPPVIAVKAPQLPRERKKIKLDPKIRMKPGELPPLKLLNPPEASNGKAFANISFEKLSELVETRLADFGVEVKVTAVLPGPVITRFELELAPGVKVSKITGLAKDIARSLSAVSVRVVEVIPGKSVIGLEIPNENRELVTLHEMFDTARYTQSRSPISLVLGKDIAGHPVIADLSKMPHLLVAGTTGSGKSVSLNAMLLSILYKATPEQVRLILVDPKMLELSIYDGIPHLLTPVITDMKEAANSLRWCVAEMDRRYRLMAALGVRNLAGYNQKVNDAIKAGTPIPMPGVLVTDEESAKLTLEPLPLIVVIVDELADMMMVVGKKVEELIARIAQKARAAGIHLIIATQRPSVDVITGLIKANIPTRISFQVSSRIDSRTILDQQGAEQLLGHGDMLYLQPGAGVPVRVHGAYVADEEVHRVVAAWRSAGEPEYLTAVTEEAAESAAGGNTGSGEQDPLYDQAVQIVMETRRASISLVQRRLRIGYNRAARMMEEMEAAGVVSTMDNSGSREVLVGAQVD